MDQMFTERVERVMILAREEAERLGHGPVVAEHMLLGLFRDGAGVWMTILTNLGVDTDAIHQSLIAKLRPVMIQSPAGIAMSTRPLERPVTSLAPIVMHRAEDEARKMKVRYVGTEHLLLALAKDRESTAGEILAAAGAEYGTIRKELHSYIQKA